MPTVLRAGPYRFLFYSDDSGEPPHVHVERDDNSAKFWLNPIRLQNSGASSRLRFAGFNGWLSNIKRRC
jgi:hypothetical protein